MGRKEITFRDVWKPPFRVSYPYIFSAGGVMSLMASDDSSEEVMNNLCALLNGSEGVRYAAKDVSVEYPCDIIAGDRRFVARGWGHLTGVGGLNLDEPVAARVQDEFVEWIVDVITE